MTTANRGLWFTSFQAGLLAALPVLFPGDGNFALYYATDTGTLYISPNPGPASFGVGGNSSWTPVGGGSAVAIADAATYAPLAGDSGKTLIFPDLTANCTVSLPAPTLGLRYDFIGKAGAADAQSWIFACTPALLVGGVLGMKDNAGTDADAAVFANGTSHVTLTVATPSAGSHVTFIGDGTHWLVSGQVFSAAAPVFS